MSTWYIAGPMTGYDDWNYPAAELGLEVWHQDGMSRLLPCPDDLFTDYRRAIAALDSITHHEIAMKYVLPQPGDASPSELRTIASEIRG